MLYYRDQQLTTRESAHENISLLLLLILLSLLRPEKNTKEASFICFPPALWTILPSLRSAASHYYFDVQRDVLYGPLLPLPIVVMRYMCIKGITFRLFDNFHITA